MSTITRLAPELSSCLWMMLAHVWARLRLMGNILERLAMGRNACAELHGLTRRGRHDLAQS